MPILEKNNCETGIIMFEWVHLKVEINSFLKNGEHYLCVWRKGISFTIKMSGKTSRTSLNMVNHSYN